MVVSELANEEGTAIQMDRLNGEWRAEVVGEITFPGQPAPSKEHWANFRKCLRLTFCKSTSPYQRKGSYKLDTRLGGWFERERQIHYPCNVTPQGIYWSENGQYYKCEQSSRLSRDSVGYTLLPRARTYDTYIHIYVRT